ncbi:hypothetical protein QZH56_00825 [Streptomyces olivoreticuli]|uniref:hypothetical protein n=1 Tax=Streptomyces olivoreticuli TaxID=68246 RepID=UPI0026599757|nr:hypothetical protein [Streptomyces olivoreticuli]WKK24254.1 hypothetical protein QZH56_00825 [Streptomyces olivoreticuli]
MAASRHPAPSAPGLSRSSASATDRFRAEVDTLRTQLASQGAPTPEQLAEDLLAHAVERPQRLTAEFGLYLEITRDPELAPLARHRAEQLGQITVCLLTDVLPGPDQAARLLVPALDGLLPALLAGPTEQARARSQAILMRRVGSGPGAGC